MLSKELEALRGADLNWAMMLRSVWEDTGIDVPELHGDLRERFARTIDGLIASRSPASPPGWVITGEGGAGKTHLLSRFRAECVRRHACFILVDLTDVRDFWEAVANGYYHSLQQSLPDGSPQFTRLLYGMLGQLTLKAPVEAWIRKVHTLEAGQVLVFSRNLLNALGAKYRAETVEHANVIRAIVGLCGGDIEIASIAGTWLMGAEIDAPARAALGLTRAQERGSQIVRGLSWLMSLAGFSVVALDQLDPIVTQLNLEKEAMPSAPAAAIISKLAAGLCELRDVTQRTLTVVSCLDRTWRALADLAPKQYAERYLPANPLSRLLSEKVVESIVIGRLAPAAQAAGVKPPYPTWPFPAKWLAQRRNDSPRALLIACHKHLSECLTLGKVVEANSGPVVITPPDIRADFAPLDARYLALRAKVDVAALVSEAHEDEQFAGVVRSAVQSAAAEAEPPAQVDVIAESSFTGAKGNPPLHARLRLVFHGESSREEHVCLRALQKKNARAFATRLRSAITQAGIDKPLTFRQLYMLRRGPLPGGTETKKLLDQFDGFGGHWLEPSDDDLRTLEALRQLREEADPQLGAWMKDRRHASKTALAKTALAPLFRLGAGSDAPAPQPEPVSRPAEKAAAGGAADPPEIPPREPGKKPDNAPPVTGENGPVISPPRPADARENEAAEQARPLDLLLGRRLIAGSPAPQPTMIPLAALQKHGIIFAGAGSGKTVLLKRLIEGAALAGVPSIVVDCANDLASLGDAWPSPPPQWGPDDAALAQRFRAAIDLIVWTPNKDAGNPIGLAPLPDLSALAGTEEEFKEAVAMAVDALAPVVATGSSAKAAKKRAVLTRALEFLGHDGACNLDGLGAVLGDFPAEATTGIRGEADIAADMADDLRAQLTINPLLRSAGPLLDPAVLLSGAAGKTRISVLSLIGLASQQEQQHFINQLAMVLFSWIKKHPTPPGMPLRGLLAIDEARDFVPSGRGSACLASMQRLTAQARKYGLGILLATQNPKDIDNKIVAQCSTQWYGKMNSPAAMDAAGELLAARGGRAGDEIGALKAGTFYVSNADHLPAPTKLLTAMCLSAHAGPMAPEDVVGKAAASRPGLAR